MPGKRTNYNTTNPAATAELSFLLLAEQSWQFNDQILQVLLLQDLALNFAYILQVLH